MEIIKEKHRMASKWSILADKMFSLCLLPAKKSDKNYRIFCAEIDNFLENCNKSMIGKK